MKNLLLSLFLIFSTFSAFSQLTFQKTYDLADDYGNNVAIGNKVVYVCGSTSNSGGGGYDAMLMKFDTLGNLLLQSQFGGAQGEIGRSLVVTADQTGVIIVGSTSSNSVSHKPDIMGSLLDDSGHYSGSLVLGFDSTTEFANDVTFSAIDGGVLIVGQTDANNNNGKTDMFIAKLGDGGSVKFMKTYGNPNSNEAGLRIFSIPQVGTIAMGYSDDPSSAGQTDAYVVHLNDSSGAAIDQLLIGTGGHDEGKIFTVDFNLGHIIIAGTTGSTSGPNRNDVFIMALDPNNLSVVWSKVYGGDSATAIQSLNFDQQDNNIVVAGNSSSYGTGSGGILFKVDAADGHVIWAKLVDGPGDDFIGGALSLEDGSNVVAGYTNSGSANNNVYLARTNTTGDLCNNSSDINITVQDYAAAMVGPTIASLHDSDVAFVGAGVGFTNGYHSATEQDLCGSTPVKQLASKDNSVRIYPNPSSGKLFIESGSGWNTKVKMSVYNMLGAEVYTKSIAAGTKDLNIDLSASPKGMYIISFNDGNSITTEKVSLN